MIHKIEGASSHSSQFCSDAKPSDQSPHSQEEIPNKKEVTKDEPLSRPTNLVDKPSSAPKESQELPPLPNSTSIQDFQLEKDDNLDSDINVGDLSSLEENVQLPICNFLKKLKLNRGRNKIKQIWKAKPFDIGRCKLSRMNQRITSKQACQMIKTKEAPKDLEREAEEILQLAENMGLKLKGSKERVLMEIKKQLGNSQV